jgi:hypothetical protein
LLGNSKSAYSHGLNLYYGSEPYLSQDKALGLEWIEKSAREGCEVAQEFLQSLK